MAETETIISDPPGGPCNHKLPHETALRSEIAFWREMIEARSDALPPEAVERMHHALALAERRLSILYEQHERSEIGNVFQLHMARRKRNA